MLYTRVYVAPGWTPTLQISCDDVSNTVSSKLQEQKVYYKIPK
jgi:hypothetical protein